MASFKYESDMTKKEKRQAELEKIRSLHGTDRLEHILAYYKTQIAVCLLAVAAVFLLLFVWYRLHVETVLNVLILNSTAVPTTELSADVKDYLGDTDPMHELLFDDSITLTGNDATDYNKKTKLAAYLEADVVDVMIMDEETFLDYVDTGLFQPFFKVMEDSEVAAYGVEKVENYGIRITGNSKLEKYGLEYEGEVCLGVVYNTRYPENARRFIEFLLEE